MPNGSAKLMLLAFAGCYSIWHYRTATRSLAHLADRFNWQEIRDALLGPAMIMTISLAVNGLAVLQSVYVDYIITYQDMDVISFSRLTSELFLLRRQLSVILGTGALYEIVRRALKTPLEPADTPKIAGLRVQVTMYRFLFQKHLFAITGVGVVFGVVAGPGIAGLLAVELALMWLLTWGMLRWLTRSPS